MGLDVLEWWCRFLVAFGMVFTLQINANVVKGVVLLPVTYTTFPLKKDTDITGGES